MSNFKFAFCILAAAMIALSAGRRASADIVFYPAYRLPETGNLSQPPDTNCDLTPDATCTGSASADYMVAAADEGPIPGIKSTLEISYLGKDLGYYITFQMWFSGMVEDETYNGSTWVGVEPGDTVGPGSGFADLASTELIDNVIEQPGSGPAYDDMPLGVNWEGPSETIYWGTEFQNQGQTHYGWIDFKYDGADRTDLVDIGGYAFELCPNTPITVGQTTGGATCSGPPIGSSTPEPGALLLLGTGIAAVFFLAYFRRAAIRRPTAIRA